MSFFCYYSWFSRNQDSVIDKEAWTVISSDLSKAALKLPRKNDVLFRGMSVPFEGCSFRIVKKCEWLVEVDNPQAHNQDIKPQSVKSKKIVDKQIADAIAAAETLAGKEKIKQNFQENRGLFRSGEGSSGLQGVKKGDLLLLDERISSFSSDPNPPIELYSSMYSSIKEKYYPSTIIIIEDGFGLQNQFSIGTCPLHVSHTIDFCS